MPSQGLLQRLDTECRLQGDRHPPGENPPTEPVDDSGQVDEAARQGHVSDVDGPDLIGAGCAHGARRPDKPIRVPGLRAAGPRADTEARRLSSWAITCLSIKAHTCARRLRRPARALSFSRPTARLQPD